MQRKRHNWITNSCGYKYICVCFSMDNAPHWWVWSLVRPPDFWRSLNAYMEWENGTNPGNYQRPLFFLWSLMSHRKPGSFSEFSRFKGGRGPQVYIDKNYNKKIHPTRTRIYVSFKYINHFLSSQVNVKIIYIASFTL